METSIEFCIEIAHLNFVVFCNYESTKIACDAFLSKQIDMASQIIISREDVAEERRLLKGDEPPLATTDEALEALSLCRKLAEYLPQHDRVLFHGSSLAMDGEGVLFTAKSGTGKSTHSRLWREVYGDRVVMINDDKPFLCIAEDGVTVCGSPWQGKHKLGTNASAPLKAICIVCRDQENRIERISPKEGFPLLLQQTYAPRDPFAMTRTLALVDRLSKSVALYRLYCNMDPEAAEVACREIFTDKKVGAI